MRAAKSTQLREYEPGRLEKLLSTRRAAGPARRASRRASGFFVRYGYHEKPVGSGIGFGGGYRHDLFDRRARIVAEGGLTFRNYNLLRADFSLPYLARRARRAGRRGHPAAQPAGGFLRHRPGRR